ncbi:hypothetical protein LBMAG47_28800 [Planctomycetia bacterium]|nr:hypothetical protein LBMAG47_28800 [Planctomycetia bacterium]
MLNRRLHGFVGMSLAATLTGCHLPANSPFTGLAQLRPIATPKTNVLPPAAMLHHPGPGVEGPGPGIIRPASYEAAMEAAGAGMAGPGGLPAMAPTSQIGFIGPDGMQVRWDVSAMGGFDSAALVAPGRYDFPQGAIYRLKLTNITGREGIELYPSLEVAPVTPRTAAYLAHNAIPFQITEEDLDQVTSGNFVTKVVYLPDPDYQELAVAGVETLVSTRLDPGCDPVVEADRRGSILAVIRIGNKDLEAPGAAGAAGVAGGPLAAGGPGGAGACGIAGPLGLPCGGDSSQLPPAFVAGMTAPQYGMPITGTPIGLPGPAHIPLGVPAGLQRHTITNHTKMHIPPPSREMSLHVQEHPGLSYPKPARHAYVAERHDVPNIRLGQPRADRTRFMDNGGPDPDALGPGRIIPGAPCPPEPLE